MKNNFKSIVLITLLTIISGSIGITPFISNYYKDNSVVIIIVYLIIMICLISLFNIHNISITDLINNPVNRAFSITYLLLSIIYFLCLLGILINNLFYIITPMTVSLSVITIVIIILSFNKRIININLFFVLVLICSFILIFFIIFFPNSNLKLELSKISFNHIYLLSYIILFIDLIFYKLYFSTKDDNPTNKSLITAVIIAFILLSFFAYLDLTITRINYTNSPFNNILKYLLVLPSSNVYFDLLYLIVILITLVFKIIIFTENLRVLLLRKKTETFFLIIYLIIFFISNTIVNLVKDENKLLNTLLEIISYCGCILAISIGGTKLVKRLYK